MGAPAIDRVWALPPCSTLGCSLSLSDLGAPAIEFGHSRQVWALLNGDDLYLSAHVYWVVSIHSGFYVQPRARTQELDLAETGSGIVEAGCCDTSQHRWQSLNEDWAFIVDL